MSDFSEFDIEFDSAEESRLPDWPELSGPSSENAIAMYNLVLERRDSIIKQLSDGVELRGKAKKIVLSDIARSIGKNPDYLTAREFPMLRKFIEETNEHIAIKKPTGAKAQSVSKDSKADLKAEVERLQNLLVTRNVEELINSRVLGMIGDSQSQRIKLEQKCDDLTDELKDLRKHLNSALNEITELVTENQNLKEQARELGGTPLNTPTLRPVK